MPGMYLAAILASACGVAALDARWRLAAWRTPGRTALAVGIGTAFFLAWDAVGIATGVSPIKSDDGKTYDVRWTSVYTREGQSWHVAASHATTTS